MPLPASALEYLILMLNVYSNENSKKEKQNDTGENISVIVGCCSTDTNKNTLSNHKFDQQSGKMDKTLVVKAMEKRAEKN